MQLLGTLPPTYANLSVEEMETRIQAFKDRLGTRLFLPAHHHQKTRSFNSRMRQEIRFSSHGSQNS